jgi:hypothetical protein
MAGEAPHNPIHVLQLVEDPALGTTGAPGRRAATLAELTSGGGGGSGGTVTPSVYGTVLFSDVISVASAWAAIPGTGDPDILRVEFHNQSDAEIELQPVASGAIDGHGIVLPPGTPPALGTPVAPTLTTATSGGNLAAGTYYYRVTALAANGRETLAGPEANATTTGSTSQITLAWDPIGGAVGYRVYGRAQNGELLLAQVHAPFFIDTNPSAPSAPNDFDFIRATPRGALPLFDDTKPLDFRPSSVAFDTNVDWSARHYRTGSKGLYVVMWGA